MVERVRLIPRRQAQVSPDYKARDADVDVVVQRVEENIADEIDVIPSHVRRYSTDNTFQRSFSYLLGWTVDDEPRKIRCSKAGVLRVSTEIVGFESYERNPTSNIDGYVLISGVEEKMEAFSTTMSRVDIRTRDNEIYMQLSSNGISWLPKILLRGDLNEVVSMDFSVKSVRFTNVVTDGTKNGRYQIVGYR